MTFGWDPMPTGPLPFGWDPTREATGNTINVTLNGLTAQSGHQPQVGPDGWLWALSSITGWREPAAVTTEALTAPSGDGVLVGPDQLGVRPVSLAGYVQAEPGAVGALERGLERLGRIRRGTLVVKDLGDDLAREADVRVLDMQVSRIAPMFARVTLSMQADDPVRYGSASVLLAASTTLINRGDMAACPLIDLVGPHGALTITSGGMTTSVVATPAGRSRTVDLRHGLVWDGTTRVLGALSGGLVHVPPGGATWTVAGLGAGSARVRRFEAWS